MSGPNPRIVASLLKSQLTYHPPLIKSSFEGQTVLVTGGNAGLGRAAVQLLVELGAKRVIIAVRNLSQGQEAKQTIEALTGHSDTIDVWSLDLASYASVIAFAHRVQELDRLDAVIENAGIRPVDNTLFEGHESSVTTNVISTCLIAHLILPKVRETSTRYNTTTRLTFVGSNLHKFATLTARKSDEDNLFIALDKQPMKTGTEYDARYNDTKLLMQMYGQKLAEEHKKRHGEGVCITVMNPGYCHSGLAATVNIVTTMFKNVLARSTEEGGRCLVDAVALDKAAGRHGQYIDDCQIKGPAPWLSTEDGRTSIERVWKELNTLLDGIVPGLTTQL